MIALAYPDRIGLRRKGGAPRFLLSGGKGAILNAEDPLSSQRLLVAADLDGNPKEAKIRAAIALSEAELRSLFADQIEWKQSCLWSKREARVVARKIEYFGALALTEQIWNDAPELDIARAMLEGVREIGFVYAPAARRFISRVNLVGRNMPDFSEAALMEGLERWLLPYLGKIKNAESWKNFDILPALQAQLSWEQTAELDRLAPAHFVTPLNRKVAIDYSSGVPEIAVRLQEMFGQTSHPNLAETRLKSRCSRPLGGRCKPQWICLVFGAAVIWTCAKTCAGAIPSILGLKTRRKPCRACIKSGLQNSAKARHSPDYGRFHTWFKIGCLNQVF
jgi:ATP-dependent helicase HrpB